MQKSKTSNILEWTDDIPKNIIFMILNSQETKFWRKQIKNLSWFSVPKNVVSFEEEESRYKWFEDGKLNACFNAVDRNIERGYSDKVAIKIVEKNGQLVNYTYGDLYIYIINFSSYLIKNYNLKKIKKIMIHGSTSIEVIISMLTCARLGITYCVVFQELFIEAINKRVKIFQPDIFITVNENLNTNKIITKIPKIKFTKSKINKKNKYLINLKEEFYDDNIKDINCEKVSSDSNFFVLFTSGTTGLPKGIVHSLGGFLVYTYFSCKYHFGINQNSVFLNTSNPGWINGNNYSIFGPLLFGATVVLFEDASVLLKINHLKEILIKNKVTIIYLPVTLIRMMKSLHLDNNIKSKYLISLGSMGEHLASNVAKWYSRFFNLKTKAIINAYYQTENGAILSSPTYKDNVLKSPHGSIGRPHQHIKLRLIRDKNNSKKFQFVVKKPWPGCMKTVLNGKKVWLSYWDKSNFFKMYDFGYKNNNSYFVNGRTDDVINIRGHRIGSAEVESVILQLDQIHEVAAISVEDKISGFEFILFVVSKNKNLNKKIDRIIINNFGNFAIPKEIFYVKYLPKTRSGKIIRRLLKEIVTDYKGKSRNDLSTMLNPESIEHINKTVKISRV